MRARPRVHGNGFIQLDLTPTRRLHIWGHPDIPRQKVSTPIHDHMFGFTSRIILGHIINVLYASTPNDNGPYIVHQAQVRDREDTVLRPIGRRCALDIISTPSYYAGDTYTMEPGQIHQSMVDEMTATIIEKTGPSLSQGGSSPNVYVLQGYEPDNEFNRYAVSEDLLWNIISEVLFRGR